MRSALALAVAIATASFTSAQVLVTPAGYAATEGNANNAFPWNRASASMRCQFIYDSSNFTSQSITGPVLITRLRYRAEAGTTSWTGGTYGNVRIDMSTCPVDFTAVSGTFASNHGLDVVTALNGPVVIQAGTGNGLGIPGPWHIDIALSRPFVYDPSLGGDVCVDIMLDGSTWAGGTLTQADHVAATPVPPLPPLCSRVYDATTNTPNNATGTVATQYGAVCEFTCASTNGLYPSFSATPTRGASPLLVQFTDRTYSSAPGGVLTWQWDLDGDTVIDSTLQNPSFTYNGCGSFNVSLTVLDATHGQATFTQNGFVVTDEITPRFAYTLLAPGGLIQFTDTSTPAGTSWSWDLNGDSVPDSTLQNPIWNYQTPTCTPTPTTVTLTVRRNCRGPFTVAQRVFPAGGIETRRDGNTSTTTGAGNYFDVTVTNPRGISVCLMEMKTVVAASAPVTFNVFITPGTYVNNTTNLAAWRMIASASTTGAPGAQDLELVQFNPPFYLAPGSYGMHVQVPTSSPQYTSATGTWSNADLSITTGAAGVLGAAAIAARTWNGSLQYSSCNSGGECGYGYFAPGCAGTAGTVGNVVTTPPRLGQVMSVNITNLPAPYAVFFLVGFSRTASAFGPLPLNLAVFGAPNCFGRVSPDSNVLLVGAAGTATFNLPIPNSAVLQCQAFYTQGLAVDAAANTMGATAGDAAAAVVGS